MESNSRSPRYPSNYRCMIESKAACRKPSPYVMDLAGQASEATSRSVQCPCTMLNEGAQTNVYNNLQVQGGTGGRFPVRMPYNYNDPASMMPSTSAALSGQKCPCGHQEMQLPNTNQARCGRPQNLLGRPRTLTSDRSTPYSTQRSTSKCPCSSSGNDDEFFSLSSASSERDNDSIYRSAEGSNINNLVCSLRPLGQGQPKARNMVILELLHEIVHLLNEDEKTTERNMREGLTTTPGEKPQPSDCDCGASEAEEDGQYSSSFKINLTPSHKTSQPCIVEEQQQPPQLTCMPCGVFVTPNMQCPACIMHAMQPQLQLLHQGVAPVMNWPPGEENINYELQADPNNVRNETISEMKSNFVTETDPLDLEPGDLAVQFNVKPEFLEDTAANIKKLDVDNFDQCICQPGEQNAACPMHGLNTSNKQLKDGDVQCICQPDERDDFCPMHGLNAGDVQCICQPGERNDSCPMHGLVAGKLLNKTGDTCICQPGERNESCPMHGGFDARTPKIRVRSDIYENDPNINSSGYEHTRTESNESSSEPDIECEENDEECLFEKARRKAARTAKKSKGGKKCDCCHCRAVREQQNKCLTIATPEQAMDGKGGNEMKFFIDSIIMDLEAMEHARRLKQNQQNICPPPKQSYCPRQSFPVTIMDVTDLGSTSLYIKWCIHDCYGIGGYEIYVDGYLTNRYFHCKHEAAVICDVDVTMAHKIVLVATPVIDDNIDGMCGDKSDKSKSLVRKSDGKGPTPLPASAVWIPSIYLYDPANKREGPPILKCSC